MLAALLGLLTAASARGAAPPPARDPTAADDCSGSAERWSAAQALAWLRGQVREMRANALQQLTWNGRPVLVTLHHERLALMEALLAAPHQITAPDSSWVAVRVLAPFIELVAAQPLTALDEARVEVLVTDEGGHRYRVPYHTRRAGDGRFTYRLPLVGPLLVPEAGPLQPAPLFRVTLQLRPSRGDGGGEASALREPLRAQWALAPRALGALDQAGPLAASVRLRRLRLARLRLLHNDRAAARALLAGALACDRTPEVLALRALAAAKLSRPPREPLGPAQLELGASALRGRLGHAWALRVLVAREFLPAVQGGLLPAARYLPLQRALREAAGALEAAAPAPGPASRSPLAEVVAAALQRFDALLAEALVEALAAAWPQPTAGLAPTLVELLPRASLAPALEAAARVEAERRVAWAQLGLRPWRQVAGVAVEGAADPATAQQVSEQQLLLRGAVGEGPAAGERFTALARPRFGAGWEHAGLPARPTSVSYVDEAVSYWRRQARAATTLAALRAVARRLLAQAPSADPSLAQRARQALEASEARGAAPAPPQDPAAAPATLRRRGPAALRRALQARAGAVTRRAAALELAASARPGDRLQALLERLASDGDPVVRDAAVLGQARRGQAAALLALGPLARSGACEVRAPALATLGRRLDAGSRRQLLLAVLRGDCEPATRQAWQAVLWWHADDLELLRAGLSQRAVRARIEAALSVVYAGLGARPEPPGPE